MSDHPATFKYRLMPLLRRDEWERDTLGAELQRTRRAYEQVNGLYQASLARIAIAETQMREQQRADQPIAIDVRRNLQLHLEREYAASVMRQQEASEAGRALEQAHARFESKRLAVSTLERHRDRQADEHRADQNRSIQRTDDELWLNRRDASHSR